MKTTYISTQAASTASRLSILKMQTELAKNTKELSSGRWADVGLELGNKTGRTISLRQDYQRLDAIKDTNGLVASRLDTSQAALDGVLKNAQDFSASLIAVRSGNVGAEVISDDAKNNLQSLIASLNSSINGEYLFAGINTDVRPVTDYYSTPTSATKTAFDTELANYCTSVGAASPADLSASDLSTFIDTNLTTMFNATNWSDPTTGWSSASNQNVKSRISTSELIETSANANDPAFRKLAMAYTMVSELANKGLSEKTYQTLIDKSTQIMGEATVDLTVVKARLGTAQERLSNANGRIDAQMDILNRNINDFEQVDPVETQTRISALETQLDMAFSLTSRAQKLSLLNYL
ncbi:flagellar hook-associated family protein [Pleomorphomonas oryzae]|uniref:flagellar hook-associated family protein n=1 Tax=Pleomorphomonas oryzae TaxID=261934 RepID=UPI00041048A7|nr:flagellar hook-associated family protein [Pleomorphomonas oryzae]